MATTTASIPQTTAANSNASVPTNNYIFEYSPPNSKATSLKSTFKSNNFVNGNGSVADYLASSNMLNNAYTYNSNGTNGYLNAHPSSASPSYEPGSSNVISLSANLGNITLSPAFNGNKESSHGSQAISNSNGNSNSLTNGASTTSYSPAILSSAHYMAGLENKCLRCGNQVYALERIGPIKGNIYHKTCFKCLICERQLDLKTYYTNQVDLNDRQIYCQSHAPKSGKGVFSTDNIYIHSVLNAPKLDVMQKVDNKPKVSV